MVIRTHSAPARPDSRKTRCASSFACQCVQSEESWTHGFSCKIHRSACTSSGSPVRFVALQCIAVNPAWGAQTKRNYLRQTPIGDVPFPPEMVEYERHCAAVTLTGIQSDFGSTCEDIGFEDASGTWVKGICGHLYGKYWLQTGVGNSASLSQAIDLGYLLRGICIHNKSHNLHLILGLNCVYILTGVGIAASWTTQEQFLGMVDRQGGGASKQTWKFTMTSKYTQLTCYPHPFTPVLSLTD